jgi:hypothetical protein
MSIIKRALAKEALKDWYVRQKLDRAVEKARISQVFQALHDGLLNFSSNQVYQPD